jgi:GNAT superfamily N-acetyltransferase
MGHMPHFSVIIADICQFVMLFERIFMQLSLRTLLRLHVEAVWDVRFPPIDDQTYDITLLAEAHQPFWRLLLASTAVGLIAVWHPDCVLPARRAKLYARAVDTLQLLPDAELPSDVSAEIAHVHEQKVIAPYQAVPLTLEHQALVEQYEPGSIAYYYDPACLPLLGIVQDGRLVSIAHSSRRTSEACELGLETLPAARRQGFGLAATLAWTEAVQQEGLQPLYSALIHNQASLSQARAAGYRSFARVVTVMD